MLLGEWTRIDLRMSTKYGSINHAESGYVELGQIRRESFFSKYKNSIVGGFVWRNPLSRSYLILITSNIKRNNLKITTLGLELASIVHYTRPGSSIK